VRLASSIAATLYQSTAKSWREKAAQLGEALARRDLNQRRRWLAFAEAGVAACGAAAPMVRSSASAATGGDDSSARSAINGGVGGGQTKQQHRKSDICDGGGL